VATTLVQAGASVVVQDGDGWTALRLAAHKGHDAVATALVHAGADVDAQDTVGETALHCAARKGHGAVATTLVQAGASVDVQDTKGRTALLLAAREGHEAVVKVLVQAGADASVRNNRGETARDLADRARFHLVACVLDAAVAARYSTWRRKFTPQARHRLAAVAALRVGGQNPGRRFLERNEDAVLAAAGITEGERYDLRCPISMEVMWDPVTTADGGTYERSSILEWLRHSRKSPKTNLPLEHTRLTPNTELQNRVRAVAVQGRAVLQGAIRIFIPMD
jgi:hypothetical protein